MNNSQGPTSDNSPDHGGHGSHLPDETGTPILIVGAGAVGCLTAFKLGRAGIDVTVIECLPATSDSPRACGYYGPIQPILNELGLYELIRKEGFMTKGLCWRKKPKDDGKGGKVLGEMIAFQPLSAPDDTTYDVGNGLLNLPQADLNKLLLRAALGTGHVQVHFNTELVSILGNSDENGVIARVRDVATATERDLRTRYLVGADGARSVTRKSLGLPFPGHTWPERLIATNVVIKNELDPTWHTHYVLDRVHYTIATPLEDPVVGESTLWRYTIAAAPDDTRTDDELITDENILRRYEDVIAGPRPLQVRIQARATYRIHQRLAPTMRRGNCLLVGDAAHINNPFGALGLNTGLLDAEALGEALIMVLNENYPSSLLDVYSDERRKVFQMFVDPVSTQNKLRLHSIDADTAVEDDWYFRLMKDPSKLSHKQLEELSRPFNESWRTDMRALAKSF
ncbi:hypothetical protein LTR10_018708 [Elasticomyces elasticus]|uniref:FAD-binding domain-containing protein n=1 Tax=Exophiala sideris TaxID=1016849 RepID=A0ABR0JAC3_9EURO|nr:hypothetical protein LTR10_018708 [Elasticomyces elasticus]KAK5026256.1 hypothetical protein LTS07_007781 [Exophiala sideris]KAK5032509.1 hypothetical protein LTR13_007332 [Exophiala sideris]KAK5059668.1 hypothetical protein LTR69_006257 [Exophiala sideris]KAK5178049.1 hypothetical protein LTR44_009355 [Eurotiomycetes sp. CCFEE 6388]